jgi:hypothetical protein
MMSGEFKYRSKEAKHLHVYNGRLIRKIEQSSQQLLVFDLNRDVPVGNFELKVPLLRYLNSPDIIDGYEEQPAIVNMQVFGLLFDPISQGGDQVSR